MAPGLAIAGARRLLLGRGWLRCRDLLLLYPGPEGPDVRVRTHWRKSGRPLGTSEGPNGRYRGRVGRAPCRGDGRESDGLEPLTQFGFGSPHLGDDEAIVVWRDHHGHHAGWRP